MRVLLKTVILFICIFSLHSCSGLSKKEANSIKHVPANADEVRRVSSDDLKAALDSGESILIVDVRSANEFNKLHIAGAVSIPFVEIKARLDDLPVDKHIVFY